ncbi:MAG: hypothetical protein BRC44_06420 [Cyanobacteria bacterium QS_4_48_99]|nr:MAG: hypothetical protein BRC44_06420 [Cyanobacteria bacterium QS_4_48_99]
MNFPVNQFSQSFPSSGQPSPDSSHVSSKPQNAATSSSSRQQPISPPTHAMQYRAIGLLWGQYQPQKEQLTRGTLSLSDGTEIDAVLLGRAIGVVKNHVDLEQAHLWVVYPRTRQNDDHLHVQIVGVWEPETLGQPQPSSTESTSAESEGTSPVALAKEGGYFSVRGEVVYYSQEEEKVIVKIKQSPRRDSESPKFFKLKLQGTLPEKPLGRFWDLQVQWQDNALAIQGAEQIGILSPKNKKGRKKPPKKGSSRPERTQGAPSRPRPHPRGEQAADRPASKQKPRPKPTKRPEKKSD